MKRERIASGLIVAMLAALILGGIPMIPMNNSIVSYAATASNADRASPKEETEEDDEYNEEDSEDMDLVNDLDENGVYIATDAEAIDISDLGNVSLYGVEQYSTEMEDSIAVKVPAMIKIESYSTSVDFQIEIAGTLNENSVVMVVADETVVLESVYKDPINGVVSQEKDYIESADLETGQATINGNITLDKGVSAGKWSGSFNIDVWLDSLSEEVEAYPDMKMENVKEIGKASSSNAEKVEEVTDVVQDLTEQEVVEQPEKIVTEETEINSEAEDNTASENVEQDTVLTETGAMLEESTTEEVIEENTSENEMREETESEETEHEVEKEAEESEADIASPSNATAI